MSRAILIVLALAAVVAAKPKKPQYAFNQEDEILDRVWDCLSVVPQEPSSFYTPASYCYNDARGELRSTAISKEKLGTYVVKCLKTRVDADGKKVLPSVKQCLTESLAKDVVPALEEADYSVSELREIEDRIKACLAANPTVAKNPQASNCYGTYGHELYPKEAYVGIVTRCLNKRGNFNDETLADEQQCLTASLAKPFST